MSSHPSLETAAQERKARLAQLKSLKRKQPEPSTAPNEPSDTVMGDAPPEAPDVTRVYLSGRNYDHETRGPKLGFELAPTEGQETLEDKAAALAEAARKVVEQEDKEDVPLDLFKLQPKRPNWDLKRALKERMDVLDVRTDNAIARLVRDRLGAEKQQDGSGLLETVHAKEREEAEEERREKEWE
ncbi:hypothetical protein EJ06DRAFT_460215, partial [Trichodelitschia bisporula]